MDITYPGTASVFSFTPQPDSYRYETPPRRSPIRLSESPIVPIKLEDLSLQDCAYLEEELSAMKEPSKPTPQFAAKATIRLLRKPGFTDFQPGPLESIGKKAYKRTFADITNTAENNQRPEQDIKRPKLFQSTDNKMISLYPHPQMFS